MFIFKLVIQFYKKNSSAVLEENKSPGSAVVNLVCNDTVIWTKGFGLINDSGNNL